MLHSTYLFSYFNQKRMQNETHLVGNTLSANQADII